MTTFEILIAFSLGIFASAVFIVIVASVKIADLKAENAELRDALDLAVFAEQERTIA